LFLFGAGFCCFAQDALSFDDALKDVSRYLTDRMPANSTVAVLNFQSDYPNLSEYIIDDITSSLVNSDLFTVVDRRSLELLEQELAFQLSGEVSDETALAIGRKLGAQTIISGAISYLGDFYRMRIQAIEVETARLQGSRTITIRPSRLLATLIGNPWTGPDTPETPETTDAKYVAPDVLDTSEAAPTPAPAPAPAKPPRTPPGPSNTRLFYMGLRGGFSTHIYRPNEHLWWGDDLSAPDSFSGDFSAQMSLQIFRFLALQAEAVFIAGDSLEIQGSYSDSDYSSYSMSLSYSAMMLPVLGKFTFRPGLFLLAGFWGIYFNVPFGAMSLDVNGQKYSYNYTAPMGFIAGGNIGIKLGPGTLFLDIRYAKDFGVIRVEGDWGSQTVYKRQMVFCSVGYEFGFGTR
jgi:TolB-like protein